MIPFVGIKCPNLPRDFLTTEQDLLTIKFKYFIYKRKMQRKGKLPIALMLGTGKKELQFFSLELDFLGFSQKYNIKYNLPQGTFKNIPFTKVNSCNTI